MLRHGGLFIGGTVCMVATFRYAQKRMAMRGDWATLEATSTIWPYKMYHTQLFWLLDNPQTSLKTMHTLKEGIKRGYIPKPFHSDMANFLDMSAQHSYARCHAFCELDREACVEAIPILVKTTTGGRVIEDVLLQPRIAPELIREAEPTLERVMLDRDFYNNKAPIIKRLKNDLMPYADEEKIQRLVKHLVVEFSEQGL